MIEVEDKKPHGPSIVQETKTRKISQPGKRKQVKIALLVIVLITLILGGGWRYLSPSEDSYLLRDYESHLIELGSFESSLQASGTVEIDREVDIPSRQEGYASLLLVKEGDFIRAGQVLATIDVPDLQEDLEDYQLDLSSAQIDLEEAIINQKYQLLDIENQIDDLKKEIIEATEERNKFEELVRVNASRVSELEESQEALDDLKGDLDDLFVDLEKQELLDKLEIRSCEEEIIQLEVKIDRTNKEIDETKVSSPIDGEVQSIAKELAVAGSYIEQNETLLTISDRNSALLALEVYEEYSSYLSEGQKIVMTISDKEVVGTITWISQYAVSSSDGLGSTVTVEVTPDQSSGFLTPGATGVADISLGVREGVMTLPRGSYLTTGSQKYLYVIRGDKAEKVKVTFGAIEDSQVEVLTGVGPGDRVIISGYQNFIEYTTLTLED